MLKVSAVGAIIAALALSETTQVEQSAPTKRGFESFVLEKAGAAAVRCGTFKGAPYGTGRRAEPSEIRKIAACATAAWQSGRPFFFAVEGSAVDSWTATGLLRAKGGPIMVFWYDSAPCGNDSCKEEFSVYPCPQPPKAGTVDPQMKCSDYEMQ